MYCVCRIKNISGQELDIFKSWSIGEEYTVPDNLRVAYANNSSILKAISDGNLQVGDGAVYFSDLNKQLKHIQSDIPKEVQPEPFATKAVEGYKLFQRVHGVLEDIPAGETGNIDLVVPYDMAKINHVDIVGGDIGDTVNFKVYDTPTGTISTVPNYMLNQFGFDVCVRKDLHECGSSYDASLIKDMKLRAEYTNNGASSKTIGVNFKLHEMKE